MIKINLLPQKRAKRRSAGTSQPASRELAIGVAALVGLAAVVFFAVDQPRRAKLHELTAANAQLATQIHDKEPKIKECDQRKKAKEEADKREAAINRLKAARVVPADVLQELGEILTQNHLPTMTADMVKLTGLGGDPNKQFDYTWDPSHVWLTSYEDRKGGEFLIEGGAQAENDIEQFSKRLAASVFFSDVGRARSSQVADKDSGVTYYKFTITGKVAY